MEQLLATPIAYVGVFVLGALFGSFANVCIYRLPDEKSIVTPGSHCFACKAPVAWYDNVPLLSYLWLRGRCRSCGAEFSARYLFVEAATAMLFVAVYELCLNVIYVDQGLETQLIRAGIYMLFVFVLVVITFIDIDEFLILDVITKPSVVVFYGLGLLLPENRWYEGLIGAAVGYGIVFVIAKGYERLRGREGMGMGDGKLLAVIGALMGWEAVVFALFAGSIIGVVINLPILILARRRDGGSGETAPEATGEASDGDDGDDGDAGDADDGDDGDDGDQDAGDSDSDYIGHAEIPFGPALAAAALVYLFVEPWLEVQLRGLTAV